MAGVCSGRRRLDARDGREPFFDDYEELMTMDWRETCIHMAALVSTIVAAVLVVRDTVCLRTRVLASKITIAYACLHCPRLARLCPSCR